MKKGTVKMKKILMLLCLLFVFPISVFAEGVPLFSDMTAKQTGQQIHINANVSNLIVKDVALYVKKVESNNGIETVSDRIVALKQVSVTDNKLEYAIKLADEVESGQYRLFVGTVGSGSTSTVDFAFKSKSERTAVLEKIKNKDYTSLESLMQENEDIFLGMGCDISLFSGLEPTIKTKAENYIVNGLDGVFTLPYTEDTFSEAYAYCIAYTKIVFGENPTTSLSESKNIFGLDGEIRKSDYIDGCLKQVTTSMGKDGMKNTYMDAEAVDKFRSEPDYKNIYTLLTTYSERLDISLSEYDSLSKTAKTNVQKGMIGVEYDDKEAIKTKYEKLIKDNKNVKDTVTGGSGGSSGGSGGSGGSSGGGSSVGSLNGSSIPSAGNNISNSVTGNSNGSTIEKVTFYDLSQTEWAREAIEELATKNVISGMGDGSFEPNRTVKREEFVKMIICAFSFGDIENQCSFTDVPEDSWYHDYVLSAVNAGIVYGKTDEIFGTGENITREDMAVMLYRTAGKAGIKFKGESTVEFSDENDFSDYAAEAVNALVNAGVISGKGDNLFAPADYLTRAEAARVIYELTKLGEV